MWPHLLLIFRVCLLKSVNQSLNIVPVMSLWIGSAKLCVVTDAVCYKHVESLLPLPAFLLCGCCFPYHLESLTPWITVSSLCAGFLLLPTSFSLPSSLPVTLHFIPKKNSALPSKLVVFTFLCSFPLCSLARWLNQFHQMTFLAAVKRKPRAS